MAKVKTTGKATGKATRTGNAKKVAAKSTAKKSAKPSEKSNIDRRTAAAERRRGEDRRRKDEPVAAERRKLQRRVKVNRRRQIDPTTCERDYTDDELEFMNALDEYKRSSGRMFPTCSEMLEVFKGLGYEKRPQEDTADDENAQRNPADQPAVQHTAEGGDCEKTDHPLHADMPLDFEGYNLSERVVF